MHTITVVNLNYICLQQYSTYLRVLRLRVQLRLRISDFTRLNYVDVHNYWVNVMFENPIQNDRELEGFNSALEKDFSVVESFNSIWILKLIVVIITYNELRADNLWYQGWTSNCIMLKHQGFHISIEKWYFDCVRQRVHPKNPFNLMANYFHAISLISLTFYFIVFILRTCLLLYVYH